MIRTRRPPTRSRAASDLSLPAWAKLLFAPRAPGSRISRLALVDCLVFLLYVATIAFAILHHLASDDEAQAWLLARDNSLHDLLLRRMHYEGAPGLWVTILWAAIRLHLPFQAINWIGGAFACVGVLILLFRSPFPPIIRWLLPFTFFFAYQYAVIARPYTLFSALTFLLCILYTQRSPRPILFALVAGVLANIGLHAAVLAGVFCLIYLSHLRRYRQSAAGARDKPAVSPARVVTAGLLFSAFAVASLAVAVPAADVVIAGNPTRTIAKPASLLAKIAPPERLPQGAPPLDEALDLGSIKKRQLAAEKESFSATSMTFLVRTLLFGLDIACFPIAQSNLLNVTFFVTFFLWLRGRHGLRFLLPWLVALLFSVHVLVLDHHTGQFAVALIAAAWLSLADHTVPTESTRESLSAGNARLDLALTVASLLVILVQISWTSHAILYERQHPYDPGRATAEFLRANYSGKRIDGFSYESISTEANSATKLFSNQPAAYWIWSGNTYPDLRRTEARLGHPDVVVQGDFINGDESPYNQWGTFWKSGEHPYRYLIQDWQSHGFHETRRFCGQRLMRMGLADTFCEIILEPNLENSERPLSAQPPQAIHDGRLKVESDLMLRLTGPKLSNLTVASHVQAARQSKKAKASMS